MKTLENKEKLRICRQNWRLKNKEHIKKYNKKYQKEHPEYFKKYQDEHSEYYNEQTKEWKLHNKEHIKLYNKKWQIDNPDYQKNYKKELRKNNPNFKLYSNMRSVLWQFLKSEKTLSTNEYLCCTQEQLWTYLETQFRDGMTRENYGSIWHVDHIIPLQFFIDNDLMDETSKKIACHYGNLQPLFAQENFSKGNKIPEKKNFNIFY